MIGFKRKRILGKTISKRKYEKDHLDDLTDEQLIEYVELTKLHRAKLKENDEYYLGIVCEKSGWDEAKAREEMEKCKKRGVSYFNYARRCLWQLDEKGIEDVIALISTEKGRITDNKEKYIELVREEMGWSRGIAEMETLKIRINCGASFEDIFNLRLFERTPEEQKKFITLGLFNKLRTRYNDYPLGQDLFENKKNFDKLFGQYMKRKWLIMPGPSLEEFAEKLEGVDRIFVKPVDGMKGRGIESFELTGGNYKEVYDAINDGTEKVVEEYIYQHEDMMKLCQEVVNSVRVVTLRYNDECKFLYAGIRIGKEGLVDNFHAGGVATTIDIPTGITCTDAMDIDGNRYEKTPATGAVIKGFKVPFWNEICDICREASSKVEEVKLVGWDFAITPKGPELIEGNQRVGYAIGQVPGQIGIAEEVVYPYI